MGNVGNYGRVASVAFYVPSKRVSNDDLSQYMDTSDTWIRERTGIEERRHVEKGVGTSDLGVLASRKVLEKQGLTVQDVDLILACTLSPDYYFPGIGVMIQNKLGAQAPGIDIRGQCSGFSWGLQMADQFLSHPRSLYRRILLVGAEIHSKALEFSNRGRNVSVLFGDGAGAMILERCEGERPTAQNQVRGLIDHEMGSDGSGADSLCMKRPGFCGSEPFFTEKDFANKTWLPHMDGMQVFRRAIESMVKVGETLLRRNSLRPEDIDLLIPHQANLRINEQVRQRLGISNAFNNIQRYGNTTAATLPIAMEEAESQGVLSKGKLLLTLAFGAGFTWGGNLIRW